MIEIRQLQRTEEWDNFVRNTPYSPMTQAVEYGKFYESMGMKYFIIGAYGDEVLVGGALVIVIRAKRGAYFYLPYGPLAEKGKFGEVLNACATYLTRAAKKYKVSWIRISPFEEVDSETEKSLKQSGFRKAPIHALAETTCILEVTHSEEELLSKMNKNHRNLIRRCEKEGVVVKSYTHVENVKDFHTLQPATVKRHKFVQFSDEYVEKEFTAFEEKGEVTVFYSYLPDGSLDSSAVVYYYGTTAAYRHGASLRSNNKIPTPYLLQWEAIKEAKRRGMHWYNFWGVAPEDASDSHPFKGITHFKKGFGGDVKNLVECHDLIISKARYWPMWLFETLRRIKRGF